MTVSLLLLWLLAGGRAVAQPASEEETEAETETETEAESETETETEGEAETEAETETEGATEAEAEADEEEADGEEEEPRRGTERIVSHDWPDAPLTFLVESRLAPLDGEVLAFSQSIIGGFRINDDVQLHLRLGLGGDDDQSCHRSLPPHGLRRGRLPAVGDVQRAAGSAGDGCHRDAAPPDPARLYACPDRLCLRPTSRSSFPGITTW